MGSHSLGSLLSRPRLCGNPAHVVTGRDFDGCRCGLAKNTPRDTRVHHYAHLKTFNKGSVQLLQVNYHSRHALLEKAMDKNGGVEGFVTL